MNHRMFCQLCRGDWVGDVLRARACARAPPQRLNTTPIGHVMIIKKCLASASQGRHKLPVTQPLRGDDEARKSNILKRRRQRHAVCRMGCLGARGVTEGETRTQKASPFFGCRLPPLPHTYTVQPITVHVVRPEPSDEFFVDRGRLSHHSSRQASLHSLELSHARRGNA
ncbi:hypothetical protein DM02DRAFT_64939 [Periconia macrospinosa]|uniref:Uncharacterized protein n=1 Tax=Periconia macrospinosa TaxID=97972 RepID=A0A2V1DIB5_9PLEO|nr:hypothetical protein DM02DRAFT_64939 [Periconia macrospinosa]